MGNTKLFQIFHTSRIPSVCPLHRKRLVLSTVDFRYTAFLVIRKIFNMKLIYNLLFFCRRRFVLPKAFRIGAP